MSIRIPIYQTLVYQDRYSIESYFAKFLKMQRLSCKVVLNLSDRNLTMVWHNCCSICKIRDYLLCIFHYSCNCNSEVYPAKFQQYLTVNMQDSFISNHYLAKLLHMTDIFKKSSKIWGYTLDSWIYVDYLVRFRNREYRLLSCNSTAYRTVILQVFFAVIGCLAWFLHVQRMSWKIQPYQTLILQ